MERKSFLALSFFAFLSTAFGWQGCSLQLVPNLQLSLTCNTSSYDCSEITCAATFSQEAITLSMYINQWRDPMSADVSVAVPALKFDWSATFKDGQRIEVPGFPLEIEGFPFEESDVYLEFSLKKDNGTINFKVDLLATTEFEATPYKITLIEGKIPEEPEPEIAICYGYYNAFQGLPLIAKMMILTSAIAILFLVVLTTVYCCKKSRATTANQVKVKPPSYNEATSTKTKVPMQPLINEV